MSAGFFLLFVSTSLALTFSLPHNRYVRTVGSFAQIVLRGAGHIAPYDQGRTCKDMLNRFVMNIPFTD